MIFRIISPEGITIAEAPIPDDLWQGIVSGRYVEIVFPMDLGPMPRMVTISEPPK